MKGVRNCDLTHDELLRWPAEEWEYICRRMQLCLARRCPEAAHIALSEFAERYRDGGISLDSEISSLLGRLDQETVKYLEEAGFQTLRALAFADDNVLQDVYELGTVRVKRLRRVLRELFGL